MGDGEKGGRGQGGHGDEGTSEGSFDVGRFGSLGSPIPVTLVTLTGYKTMAQEQGYYRYQIRFH